MKSLPTRLLSALVLSALAWSTLCGCNAPPPKALEIPRLEPVYQGEIEHNSTFRDQPQKETEPFYTAAEVPWIQTDFTRETLLEYGFKQKEEPASFDFDGKKVEGRKISWEDDKDSAVSVAVPAIHAWVWPELKTPPFVVRLGRKVEFVVPAGCVKLEVARHEPPGAGIDAFAYSETLSAKGEYKKPTKYKIGEKEYDAHEFSIEISSDRIMQTNSYIVSQEAPGGIFSRVSKGTNNRSSEVKSLTTVPPPANLEYFPEHGFAYAPPQGYEKKTPGPGEVASYRNKEFADIKVSVIDLPPGGLSELVSEAQKEDRRKEIPKYLTENQGFHVAGHFSFTGAFPASLVTQHGKRGYIIAIQSLNDLPNEKVTEILKGWRWIAESAK